MGISTTQAWNDIVTGIGRKSPILDNLGIVGLKMERTRQSQPDAQLSPKGQKMIAEAGSDCRCHDRLRAVDREDRGISAKLGSFGSRPTSLISVDFASRDEGWINTLDYLQIINEWAAKEHKSTIQVIVEHIVPGGRAPERWPGEGSVTLPEAIEGSLREPAS